MSKVLIDKISKHFGPVEVLQEIELEIPDGSFTVLLGPSGCGKSTLLRIIAGLEKANCGQVSIGERVVTQLAPGERDVAMVFQNYALYPHLTVRQNIEYGLKARKVKKGEREKLVQDALEMVRLTDQASKLPAQMSGGQRQRVALARAIVKRPHVFLMDEPLSNLDAKLRGTMRAELTDLYRRLKTTFLYVTHDQVEAMSMGTNIVILDKGVIQQQGTPREIYENPANTFVAAFIGSPPATLITLRNFTYGVRPEHVALHEAEEPHCPLYGRIISSEHLGSETVYSIETALGMIIARGENRWNSEQCNVRICLPYEHLMVFDQNGRRVESEIIRDKAVELFEQNAHRPSGNKVAI